MAPQMAADRRDGEVLRVFEGLSGRRTEFLGGLEEKQARLKALLDALQQENDEIRSENENLKAENCSMRGEEYRPTMSQAYYKRRAAGIPTQAYRQAKILRAHDAPVHSVNAGPGGIVATASWDATIHIYDLEREDGEAIIRTLGGQTEGDEDFVPRMGGLYDVNFSKTQPNILAAASSDKFVYVWNWEKNRLLTKLGGHTDEVNGVVFHPSQQVMVTSSDDTTAIVWDYQEGIKLRTLDEHTKAVYGATFLGAENAYCCVTTCFDQKVRVWDMRDKSVVQTLQCHTDDVVGIDSCESRSWVATSSDDGTICIFDSRVWDTPLHVIDTRQDQGIAGNEVKRIKFNSDGTKLASGNSVPDSSAQQVCVYDLTGDRPELFGACTGHTDCVFDCCFATDSLGVEFLVDTSHDWTCYVWRQVR